jgi:hypothetical protein
MDHINCNWIANVSKQDLKYMQGLGYIFETSILNIYLWNPTSKNLLRNLL